MKHKLVIVENNFCKFFAAKQLLELHFKLNIEILEVDSDYHLDTTVSSINPNAVLSHETLGVLALCEEIQKRNLNRRNCQVYLIIKDDLPDSSMLSSLQKPVGISKTSKEKKQRKIKEQEYAIAA